MKLYLDLPHGQGAYELTLEQRTCLIMKEILKVFQIFNYDLNKEKLKLLCNLLEINIAGEEEK